MTRLGGLGGGGDPDAAAAFTLPPAEDRAPRGFFGRYAAWTVRRRWVIVAAWLLTLGGLVALPPIGSGGNELASIIPLDSPAIRSELRSLEEFGFPLSSRVAVVQRNPDGLSPFVQAESVLDALAVNQAPKRQWPLLGALPLTNSFRLFGPVGETNTAVLTYLFMDPVSSFSSQQDAAERYVAANLERPVDHVVGVAGSVPARAQQAKLVGDNLHLLEVLTVLAIVLLVGVTFRSVVAPAIALTASGIAFVATINLSELLSGLAGIATPAELEPLLVALLLGVVTDYTIFYVTALQSRIGVEPRWRDAVRDAVRTDTPIVTAAGVTVAAGTAALLAANSEFFRAFGPAMALAVVVGLVVSITFVPAAIAVLGPVTFWPSDPRRRRIQAAPGRVPTRSRHRLVRLLGNRPAASAVVVTCVGLLLLCAAPLRELDLGVGFTSSLPSDNPVAVASDAASQAFAPGITSPTTMLVERDDVVEDTDRLAALQHLIEQQPGVAGVVGPAQNITEDSFNVVLSKSGNAARMLIVLDHDPLDATAITDLRNLRDNLPSLVQQAGLTDARTSLGGDTALAEGLVASTEADLYRIAIAGIVVNLLLLVLFLRALVAPLFLLASSILALTASLGLTVWLFGSLGGVDGLTFYVPFAAAVLLVSLGSDYNIFGVGRVWEEARHLPLRQAVLKAVPESSRAITAAGVTLAVSFGMLALIPLTPFRELAFAMAVGILIDAFVVRSLLVPAMLILVGPLSGWPGPHLRADRHTKR